MQVASQTTAISGAVSGTIGLSFSVQDDWNGTSWTYPSPTTCGGNLADGSTAQLMLNVLGESPGEIYLYGGATLTLKGLGQIVSGETVGGGGGIFKPGTANQAVTSGVITGSVNAPGAPYAVSYKIQFSLPITFDGGQGAGSGTWQMEWTATPSIAAPTSARIR